MRTPTLRLFRHQPGDEGTHVQRPHLAIFLLDSRTQAYGTRLPKAGPASITAKHQGIPLNPRLRHPTAPPPSLPKGKQRWLSAETWCDALILPRPRFALRTVDGGEKGSVSGSSGRIASLPGSPIWPASPSADAQTQSRAQTASREEAPQRAGLKQAKSAVQLAPSRFPVQDVIQNPSAGITGRSTLRAPRSKSFALDDLALPSPVPSLAISYLYPLDLLQREEIAALDPAWYGLADMTHKYDVISRLVASPSLQYDGASKPVKAIFLPNPSHEAVNPVALGKPRAKQFSLLKTLPRAGEFDCRIGDKVLCVQLYGDASLIGQGIIIEGLSLSNLPRYTVGGSVHIVLNTSIGHTAPASTARSSPHRPDIAKMINAPVLHVNGDYAEDVLARADIIIDLIVYRRWGHIELDEPAFTQPLTYEKIRSRRSVPSLYGERLIVGSVFVQNM
ncbi:putative 2-oxoglutarate dehydrogenase E1 component DHKTD1, mitochondrial [Grifola frondosa]|uniref:Putative 2-oxoglutarate dehydrogenase E1 component DHKTD1, mitochondrial n=1 Tax=Grifola frondosa TaxID=5627 RepID=A0A1C7LLQ2_GRIFR|nr:putative 2-oxoglutarate dehydrogenase E1 component DHKTD1, mitochondrial [Grifola frondosa]